MHLKLLELQLFVGIGAWALQPLAGFSALASVWQLLSNTAKFRLIMHFCVFFRAKLLEPLDAPAALGLCEVRLEVEEYLCLGVEPCS